MENKVYTNKELGDDYLRVVRASGKNHDTYHSQKRLIANLNIDLFKFYNENEKSFSNLNIKRIGKKTKEILEMIIENGVEETRKKIIDKKEQNLENDLYSMSPLRVKFITDHQDSSWDNSVRINEQY